MGPDILGWFSTAILIATVGGQTYTQWRDQSTAGVSSWLFIGQLAASTGFVIYSWLLGNWVFVVTNAFLLVIAAMGQWFYKKNEKKQRGRDGRRAAAPKASR